MGDSENIGGLGIDLGLDFSGLQADLDAAVALVSGFAPRFAEAFNAALSSMDTAPITAAMEKLGSAATSASQPVVDLAGSINDLGGGAVDISGTLDSLAQAMDSARGAAENYAGSAEAVMQAQQDADETLATAQQALADIQGLYDTGAASANDLARAADAVASAFDKANPSIQESGEHAHEASGGFGELGTELLKLGGIALTIEGLRRLGEEAMSASDNVTHAAIALTAITGNGEAAAETLERLEALGMADALSMPGLRDAATAMTNMLPAGTDVVEALSHIADGAAVMGTSIDAAARKFDTITESGNVSARALGTLGIRLDDISTAMTNLGVPAEVMAEGVQAAFKSLDQEDRVNVLIDALSRLDGVATNVAQNTFGGVWQTLANQWESDMQKMGDSMKPMVQDLLPGLVSGMHTLEAAAILVTAAVKVSVDGTVGLVATAVEAIVGLNKALRDGATLNFSGAALDIANAMENVKAIAKSTADSISTDLGSAGKTISGIFSTDVPKALSDSSGSAHTLTTDFHTLGGVAEELVPLAQATHDFRDNIAAAGDAAQVAAVGVDAMASKITLLQTQAEHANANLITANQTLADTKLQADAGAASVADVERAEQNVAKAATLAQTAQEAYNKALLDTPKITFITPDVLAELQALPPALQAIVTGVQNMPAPISATNQAMIDFGTQAGKVKTAVADLSTPVDTLITDFGLLAAAAQDSGDWGPVNDALEKFDKRVTDLAKTDLPGAVDEMGLFIAGMISAGDPIELIAGQMEKYEGFIQKLAKTDMPDAIAAQGDYINKLGEMGAPLHEVYSAIESWDKMQIQLAEDSGTSASTYIINLARIKQANQDAHDSFQNLLGNVFVDIQKSWNDAFTSLGSHLTDAITGAKSWHDALQGFLQDIEKEIVNNLIGTVLKGLESSLDSVIGKLVGGITGGFGTAAGAAGTFAGSLGQCTTTIGSLTGSAGGAATSLGGSAAGLGGSAASAASSLVGMVGAIGSVVGAIAGIVGDVEQAHANNLLGEIEVSTRGTLAEMGNLRADLWSQFNGEFQRLGDIWSTLQSMGANAGVGEGEKNIYDALSSMGQTLVELDQYASDILDTLKKGIGTTGSGSATSDLSGQSLEALHNILAGINGIWADENLVVLGIQNLVEDRVDGRTVEKHRI